MSTEVGVFFASDRFFSDTLGKEAAQKRSIEEGHVSELLLFSNITPIIKV
jgi:hypothetical protein